MENTNTGNCGASKRSSRFEQSVQSVAKLKADLAKARARVHQEARLAEKRRRYAEKSRIDSEQRMLGRTCQTIGLANFRLPSSGDDHIGQIDFELVVGGLILLVEQLRELDDGQRKSLKESGSAYIQRHIEQNRIETQGDQ